MADEQPTLHIDTDWKKKAQEEKRKLAEEQKQKAAASPTSESPASAAGGSAPATGAPAGRTTSGARTAREMPAASFTSLVQTIVTQALFYMGDLTPRGAEPQLNLDMAKHQIDLLGVLEEKTKSNLTPDEQRMLDAALYETRMRFVGIASQVVNG